MSSMASTSKIVSSKEVTNTGVFSLERVAMLYARLALGASFLGAVADRFGLLGAPGTRGVSWGDFTHFLRYAAAVNSFMPARTIPFLAWAASAGELSLGVLLILGLWPRWVAAGAALLLALFGTAMAISFGFKAPLDYSVFSASAGALLLSLYQLRLRQRSENNHECGQPGSYRPNH